MPILIIFGLVAGLIVGWLPVIIGMVLEGDVSEWWGNANVVWLAMLIVISTAVEYWRTRAKS